MLCNKVKVKVGAASNVGFIRTTSRCHHHHHHLLHDIVCIYYMIDVKKHTVVGIGHMCVRCLVFAE